MTTMRRLSELKPNPLSLAIYGTEAPAPDLMESIKEHGQLSPVVIKPDGTLLSGHRRFEAMKALGLEMIECAEYTPVNNTAEEVYIIECNRSRQKSINQLINEGKRLKKLLDKPALQARLAHINRCSETGKFETVTVRSQCDQNGDAKKNLNTRAEIAKQLGLSKTIWTQIDYVNKYADIGNPTAIEALKLLNSEKVTVGKAYRMVRKAVKELAEAKDGAASETEPQTMHDYNMACTAQVADSIMAICDILEKVLPLDDSDFNAMPWRTLAAKVRYMNCLMAKLDEKIARKRGRMFEAVEKTKEAAPDGED